MTKGLNRTAWLLSLMAPVFLSACASQSEYDRVVSENQQLQQQAAADQAHITRLQGAIKYTVNSDLLFRSGSAEMSDAGKDIVAKMAKVLAPGQQEKLVVNGYTDSAAVGPALQKQGVSSNQILSELRADAVMKYMISQGVQPELVSAQGFGEADPVASNDTAQGRAQNRRVEITLAAI